MVMPTNKQIAWCGVVLLLVGGFVGAAFFLSGNLSSDSSLDSADEAGRETRALSDEIQLTDPLSVTSIDDLRHIQERTRRVIQESRPYVVAVEPPSAPKGNADWIYSSRASGVIISPDGLVLSQHHVSHRPSQGMTGGSQAGQTHQPGEKTVVTLADGTRVPATLLGADAKYDLSLLQIDRPGVYSYATLAETTGVSVGTWVVKLGHPMGFRRDRPAPARLGRVTATNGEAFATDCLIQSGDSGGPYFDLEGRLVGIVHSSLIPPEDDPYWQSGLDDFPYSAIASPRIAILVSSMRRADRTDPLAIYTFDDLAESQLTSSEWIGGARFGEMIAPRVSRGDVVILKQGDANLGVATVVGAGGLAVTSANVLVAEPGYEYNGERVPVEVIGVDEQSGLAVVRLTRGTYTPWSINLEVKDDVLAAGSILGRIDTGIDNRGHARLCVVAVAPRSFLRPLYDYPPAPIEPNWGGAMTEKGYKLDYVWGVAAAGCLESGDILEEIGDQRIQSVSDVDAAVRSFFSRESAPSYVHISVLRGSERLEFKVPRAGSRDGLSELRTVPPSSGFEFSPPVRETSLGGPLVNLEGQLVGVTVLQFSTYAGIAATADDIRRVLTSFDAN